MSKIIRKLGLFEGYFHHEIEQYDSSINASTVMFSSKIDLFNNLDLLDQAIKYWRQTQPLLRSRVINYKNGSPTTEKYFAFEERSDLDYKLDNVSYLYFNQNANNNNNTKNTYESCKDYWKLLIEREMTIPINWKNGPMWRLKFINMGSSYKNENNEIYYDYCLIITVTHAIFDGTSAFTSLVSLFSIIEALYDKNLDPKDIYDAKVSRCLEEWVLEHLNKSSIKENLAEYVKLDGFKRPSALIINKISERSSYIPLERDINNNYDFERLVLNENAGFYSAIDNKLVINFKDLISISENSVTKFYLTTFDGDKYSKFLSVCKSKNAKVNGVFNTMFAIAWRLTYMKFLGLTQEEASNVNINFLTIVNLRSFLKEITLDSLVWFCTYMYSNFDKKINLEDEDFWEKKFWEFAKTESESFHSRLKQGEQFRLFESQNPLEKNESRIHFGLSNLVVSKQIIDFLKTIQLDNLFTLTSYRKDWTNDFCYNNIISLGDKMSWTLSYNSYFVKNETIDYFVETVIDIYDKLCELNDN